MKCSVLFLCVLATLAILVPSAVCDRAEEQELILRRNRRTVQFLVNHFVHFFGLSGGAPGGNKKIEPKQDNVFSLPLTNILKASAGKFSGGSGTPKHKPAVPDREPTLQHDLPTWIDDRPQKIASPYSEAFEADSLEPTRVSLLSTTREPEETTTASTTTSTEPPTTTTEEPAPIAPTEPVESDAPDTPTTTAEAEEPATSAPATDDTPQEGSSSTEASPIDPDDVNRLSDTGLSARSDARDQSFQPTPIPLVSYQHYVQPAIWPAGGSGFQHAFPMQQYFGNNVFIPAQHSFPLASPFQVQALQPPVQNYPTNQPLYDNRLYYQTGADTQPKSHSRVKLHDNHYDLFTYHDDTEPAASNYQVQSFGNYRNRRY
uniref:DUF4794 domain-containing protein n=1 Tax=Anopheles maculatus TaxID=74869 RepID=A0A182SN08_9DIPT